MTLIQLAVPAGIWTSRFLSDSRVGANYLCHTLRTNVTVVSQRQTFFPSTNLLTCDYEVVYLYTIARFCAQQEFKTERHSKILMQFSKLLRLKVPR